MFKRHSDDLDEYDYPYSFIREDNSKDNLKLNQR